MPEIEQPHGARPPAVRPPSEPAASQPAQPPDQRPPVDPELVQQFQQFQQFQELMRQQGNVPLLPSAQKPLWQRILRRKWVRRLVLLAILLLTLPLWWNMLLTGIVNLATAAFGSDEPNRPASETGGGLYHTNHILSDSPYEAVRKVYENVGYNDVGVGCGVFTDEAAQRFAEHFGAADCPAVIAKLNGEVDKTPGSKDAYAEPDFGGRLSTKPSAGTITISSCDLGVTAGPQLGEFTATRVELGQWIITGHRLETC